MAYREPRDGSTITPTKKTYLLFKWRLTPFPPQGRKYYEFTLFEGFGNTEIIKEKIAARTTSYEVPVEIFEDGKCYTWQVRQRAQTGLWSRGQRWSFTVKK